jgi:hypothetical protein
MGPPTQSHFQIAQMWARSSTGHEWGSKGGHMTNEFLQLSLFKNYLNFVLIKHFCVHVWVIFPLSKESTQIKIRHYSQKY